MQKDNQFGGQPQPGLGVKKQLTVEGRIKLKHLNLCIGYKILFS